MAFGNVNDSTIREVERIQAELIFNYDQFTVFSSWPRLGKLLFRDRWKRYSNILKSQFINAGTDTSLMTLQWIMANIVKHPHIQAKLFSKIKAVVGEGAEETKEENVQKMTYLKVVILETLRIHPPSTFLVPNAVSEDSELLGYKIPKDTTVNFVISLMGWDPKEWENPMEFRPERLLNREENGEPD
ncbi:cytochrome P450 89A2-like [Juglans microcarpa x Juglans regia]|uniref:cytochrome P450 89A2-like n=1 Tax=Juglans microcarpa x Juglans regia TaxID=2249226 RepID=UPI001B7E869C|nr:cytochrome P450 89A2-like [Juglans microcarpa x Juglans regia]